MVTLAEQVGLGCKRSRAGCDPGSNPGSFLSGICFSSCLEFLSWVIFMMSFSL